MKTEQHDYYRKFRDLQYDARQALRAAKTLVAFEARDDLEIYAEPEEEDYFAVYGDPDTQEQKTEIIDFIESHGVWYVDARQLCTHCGAVKEELHVGVGMCTYVDPMSPFDNAHVIDIMADAMEAVREAGLPITDTEETD